jgi:hypothetical protein
MLVGKINDCTMRTKIFIALLFFAACKKSSVGSNTGNGGTDTTTTPPPTTVVRKLVIADQSQNRVIIADVSAKTIVWEWKPAGLLSNASWFVNMSDARPVLNNQYILATASTGGVALVRIADKKTLFYAYAGNGNTHSAELLPDGNLVAACSTGGYLILFKTDTAAAQPYSGYTKKVALADAHNVVWDNKRQLLWSAAGNKLYAYRYNFNCTQPDLALTDSIALPASGCHDLFPDYGRDSLLLSTSSKVWTIGLAARTVVSISNYARIKSVSAGPSPYVTVLMQSIDTDQQWWNDTIIDLNANPVYQLTGLKAYKARWLLDNTFSYTANAGLTLCK